MNIIINGENVYPYKHNQNYYVTKTGKIYSIYIIGGQGKTDITKPHLLSYSKDKDGYRVVLSSLGKKRYVKVHTVIVEQFIGDIPKGMVVNHIDGNTSNNNIYNLEIVTPKENTIHAHLNGLTSSEIRVNVVYENKKYQFNSLTECMNTFPEISRHYLQQLRRNEVLFSNVYFKKASDKRICGINCFYNGQLFKVFKTMQEADLYFGMKRGATSGVLKYQEYRRKINKYIITFPNVSTIENTE